MRDYLHSALMPCMFARSMAAKGAERTRDRSAIGWTVVVGDVDPDVPELFSLALSGSASAGAVAVIVMPEVRSAEEVVPLLAALASSDRWRVSQPQLPWEHRPDVLPVGLHWTTDTGASTSVMGLGPIGTMPEHRRAPYVALVAWGGPHMNPLEKPARGRVSLVSAPLPVGIGARSYERTKTKTITASRGLRNRAPFGATAWRNVAFALPSSLESQIVGICAADAR